VANVISSFVLRVKTVLLFAFVTEQVASAHDRLAGPRVCSPRRHRRRTATPPTCHHESAAGKTA
jgi:hypothetical protein